MKNRSELNIYGMKENCNRSNWSLIDISDHEVIWEMEPPLPNSRARKYPGLATFKLWFEKYICVTATEHRGHMYWELFWNQVYNKLYILCIKNEIKLQQGNSQQNYVLNPVLLITVLKTDMGCAWVAQKYHWYKELLIASQTGIKSCKCEIHVAEVYCLFQYHLSRTLSRT